MISIKREIIFAAVFTTIGAFYGIKHWFNRKKDSWIHVGYLDEIYIYPFKSGKSKKLPCAKFTKVGLKAGPYLDRSFILADSQSAIAVTAKECPMLTQLEMDYRQGSWIFKHANCPCELVIDEKDTLFRQDKMETITLLDSKIALLNVTTEHISKWFANVTGRQNIQLLYHYTSDSFLRQVRPKYAALLSDTFAESDVPTCNFTSHATLVTWASINDANRQIGMNFGSSHLRYRANLLVKTLHQKPYQEDKWSKIRIGNQVQLHYNKQCHRCVYINIDPDTGLVDPNGGPLKTLSKLRKLDFESGMHAGNPELNAERHRKIIGPPLSVNLSVDSLGWIQVGDPIYACLGGKS